MVENTGRKVEYTYDLLYRLTQEKITDAVNGNRTFGYTYDRVSNRLSKTNLIAAETRYGYDQNDRLLTETEGDEVTSHTYDDNGSTLTRIRKQGGTVIEQTTYTWDYEKRLVGATIVDENGTRHLEYEYNDQGIRVASRIDGQETGYLIDKNGDYAQVLEEYTPDGTVLVSYVYGNDLISEERAEGRSFFHVDGLGSRSG